MGREGKAEIKKTREGEEGMGGREGSEDNHLGLVI